MDIEEIYQDIKEKLEQDVVNNFARDGYVHLTGFMMHMTNGEMSVGIIPSQNGNKEEMYATMAMLSNQLHPIAAAMVSEAWMLQLTDIEPEEFEKMIYYDSFDAVLRFGSKSSANKGSKIANDFEGLERILEHAA